MNSNTISSSLSELGLSNPEILVYLSLLELGSQPASIVAKKANLKRGHTYNMLGLLLQKGIVQEFIKEKVKYFSCAAPKMLLSRLEHEQEEMEVKKQKLMQILPELDKIQNPMLIQPKVRFFQGIEGLKEIYEDTIRGKHKEIFAIGDFEYIFAEEKDKELHDWIWNYADRRAKKNIWYTGIINKSTKSDQAYRRRGKQKRKMKILEDVFLPIEVNVYGNKVAITSTYKDMVGIIIEDETIAESLRNFHQAVWQFLPDYS